MNHIFHYYVTAFLALKAGFPLEDSFILAYSSQYVDNALIPYRVVSNRIYDLAHTHHFGFWSREQEDSIWIPYHFFPSSESGSDLRKDKRSNIWCVRPGSDTVKELLEEALKTHNLYRIGIALHTYADTWAHQNFTGRRDDFNYIHGSVLVPPVGHAQADNAPDIFHVRWTDPRLIESRIDNRSRFLESARSMYDYLSLYMGKNASDTDIVIQDLENILGPVFLEENGQTPSGMLASHIRKSIEDAGKKAKKIAEHFFLAEKKKSDTLYITKLPQLYGQTDEMLATIFSQSLGIPLYDRRTWRTEAFVEDKSFMEDTVKNANINDKISWIQHEFFSQAGFKVPELPARKDFFSSHLYQWSEAAYDHKVHAEKIIQNI